IYSRRYCSRSVGLYGYFESIGVEGSYQRFIQLQQRLASGADHERPRFRVRIRPSSSDGIGQVFRSLESAASRSVRTDEIRVAEIADSSLSIFLPPGPEVAAGESAEH